MPTNKKTKAKRAVPSRKPLGGLKKTHAKKLFSQVNALLADHGFAGRVRELHFVPMGADGLAGCGNCPPPRICKRVCFINGEGIPECEDRCVDPS